MTESRITLPQFGVLETTLLWVVLASAVVALLYGWYLRRKVMSRDPGAASMVAVATAIQEGAMAYLRRQLRTMLLFIVVVTAGLYLMYRPIYAARPDLAIGIAVAFLLGCFASYGAGFVGMTSAVHGNVRVANAARRSYREALQIAFQAGTISGMFTVGLGLVGATILFMLFRENATRVLVGFGFGGSLVALFMRVGGGIFTKAADVGADLVGKVEVGIPEDDPRNPATIADNVGDNVGDVAGMGADLFESYVGAIVSGMILAAETLPLAKQLNGVTLVLFLASVGVIASILGTFFVRTGARSSPQAALRNGTVGSAVLAVLGSFLLITAWYGEILPFWAFLSGVVV